MTMAARSQKQATADHGRALKKYRDQDYVRRERAKVTTLGTKLRALHARQDEALKETAAHCRAERHALAEKRQAALVALREALRAERAAARRACASRKDQARARLTDDIDRARAELEAERKYQADLRRIERGHRATRLGAPGASRAERQSESDDEVRVNIPPELLPLFEKVRRAIKGSARESRTEAFMRYAEEHPREVLAILDDQADALVREMERRQGEARPPRKAAPRTRATRAELADVPF
jgi:hypothetical protein